MKIRTLLLILPALLLWACEPEIDQFEPSAGEADFSVFVSVGNSLTAGFADGELYRYSQENSFPNIMARQLGYVGNEIFRQPLMKDDLGFGNRLVLGMAEDCQGNESLGPVPAGGTPDPGNFESIAEDGPFHNLGVPGAKTSHLLAAGYGVLNPYYGRFATNPSTSSVIGQTMALDPSFFTLWIGNNDILGFAMGGGEGEPITPPEDFQNYYGLLLSQLTANGARGAVANIPDIASIPFFNTFPYNALVLTSQPLIDMLNEAYNELDHISFSFGPNGFVVSDPGAPGGMRQLVAGEKLLLSLPMDKIRCEGWGSQAPIPAEYYLSLGQLSQIEDAVESYNAIIAQYAKDLDLALADANTILKNAKSGIYFDGLEFNTAFVTGGVFSLDGVHLSPRGNAIVANLFLEAINEQYNASIPLVSVTKFDGIIFP